MVISQFYPIIGGAERQAQLLAKTLISKGIGVRILTGWWDLKTPRKEVIEGIQVVRNFCFWHMFGIKGLRPLAGFIHMVGLGMYLLVHRREYDVIHVHQVLYPAFVSVLIGRQVLRKPVLVKPASSGTTSDIEQLKRFPSGTLQLKYLLKRMDCLVAISRAGGDDFRMAGYPGSQIVNIPNAVAIPREGKSDYTQVKHFLAIARLSREKGIDVLIKAWARIADMKREVKLFILGEGPLESDLKKLSQSLGVRDSIVFAGVVSSVAEYLTVADLFILPSRTEGLSNALLEAMSYGIPCIATRVGGSGELLGMPGDKKIPEGGYWTGSNGLLVNPDDVDGLSGAIFCLIGDGGKREVLGGKGREFVRENYSAELTADRYISLYRKLMEGKGRIAEWDEPKEDGFDPMGPIGRKGVSAHGNSTRDDRRDFQ